METITHAPALNGKRLEKATWLSVMGGVEGGAYLLPATWIKPAAD